MYNKSIQTKNKIIKVTIELMKTTDINTITLRDIAKASEIGIGLINYHFGSRESLIAEAVDSFISETINSGETQLNALVLTPVEKLKTAMTGYADFLAHHPKISKVSIINALISENSDKLSKQGMDYYVPLLSEIFKDKSQKELAIILNQIVAPIQMFFLRSSEYKELMNIDFLNSTERKSFVENLIDNLAE